MPYLELDVSDIYVLCVYIVLVDFHTHSSGISISKLLDHFLSDSKHICRNRGVRENLWLTTSHWQPLTFLEPDSNPGNGERQLAVTGNSLVT